MFPNLPVIVQIIAGIWFLSFTGLMLLSIYLVFQWLVRYCIYAYRWHKRQRETDITQS